MHKSEKEIQDKLFTQAQRGNTTDQVVRAFHDLNHDRYVTFERCPDQPCDAINDNKGKWR